MKELLVSNCEKAFVLKAIAEGTRLDGRALDECRPLKICFGSTWGSCHVSLGETKVVAHVSYKIEPPKQARANEGLLYINLELGQMGASTFEKGQSDLNVYLNRLIEKCIIDSRCVDLESLCIVAEEKVWALRVDIHVLNHAGNIIECASIAALSSLAHFKRPDVTTDGTEIIVHSYEEKDAIPTVLHHYPVCITFGFFSDELMIIDPCLLEETVCSMVGAIFVVGMNSYREVCLFDLASAAITLGPPHIYKASHQAAKRSQYIVAEIKKALAEDTEMRSKDETVGFANAIPTDKILTLACDKMTIRLKKFDLNKSVEEMMIVKKDEKNVNDGMKVLSEDGVAALLPEKSLRAAEGVWVQMGSADEVSDKDDDDPKESDDDVQILNVVKPNQVTASIDINSSSSEEEDVVTLEKEQKQGNKSQTNKKKQLYPF